MVTRGFPHRWVLGLLPFNIFISYLDDRAKCTLSKSAYETKFRGRNWYAKQQQGCCSVRLWQTGLTETHEVQQSQAESPKPGMKYPHAAVLSGADWIEISFAEKKLRFSGNKLNISQQCSLAAIKIHCIVGCTSKSVTSRSRSSIFGICDHI